MLKYSSTLHLFVSTMRKQIDLHLCDYCYKEHQKLHQNHDSFDYTRKFSVSECVGCGSCMCSDCVENSKKYLQDLKVVGYDLYLCAECILKKRSDMTYRTFVLDTIEQHERYMRISLRKTILSWSPLWWILPTWSNNTSTSPWLPKRNVQKQLSKDIGASYASSSSSSVTYQ